MNLVERYATEVGRHLPRKNRADLEQEISSLIEDAIDDAARVQGRERNEELVMEVLRRFGPPAALAASYGKPVYLIGPRLYPFFWMVLRIVLAVMLAVSAIGIGLELGQSADIGQGPVEAILGAIGGLLGALMAAFANVVLVFAILERVLPEKDIPVNEWDPSELKAEPDPERVTMAEPIIQTVFTTALLLVLNVYPQWIGIVSYVDGRWLSVPVLSPVFFSYVPFISLLLIADIVLNALLLRSGRWTSGLRWFQVVSDLASIVLLVYMLFGPSLLLIDTTRLALLDWPAEFINTIINSRPALEQLFRLSLGIAMAINVWEVASQLYRIVTHKKAFTIKASQ